MQEKSSDKKIKSIEGLSSEEQNAFILCVNELKGCQKVCCKFPSLGPFLGLFKFLHYKSKKLWENNTLTVLKESDFINPQLDENARKILQQKNSIIRQFCQEFPFIFRKNTRVHCFNISNCNFNKLISENMPEETEEAHSVLARLTDRSNRRIKFKINRATILQCGLRAMKVNSSVKAVLEYEFAGEIGSGKGPTLEFYSQTALALQELSDLWREAKEGLFPAPINPSNTEAFKKQCLIYKYMGWLIARAILDERIFDLPLSEPYWELVLGHTLGIADISKIDKNFGEFLLELDILSQKKKIIEQRQDISSEDKIQQIQLLSLSVIKNQDYVYSMGVKYQN